MKKLGSDIRGMAVRFPVELAVCVLFTVIALIDAYGGNQSGSDELFAKMEFFPICGLACLAVNFLTRGGKRWIYYLSAVIVLPVLFLNMADYTDTFGYGFGLLLSFMLMFLCRRNARDNMPFSANFATVISDFVLTGIFIGILTALVYAVLATLVYLFNVNDRLFSYGYQWSLFLLGPMFLCMRSDSHGPQGFETELPQFLKFLSKYIVSPAIIIYTIVLYAYVVRAIVTMSLPLGGVAAMVMAYYLVAMAAKMLDGLTGISTYQWFYKRFHWISLPILALFWIGLAYRIHMYALTDSRVYLIAAGVVMTAASVMTGTRRLDSYRLFTLMASAAIIVLTYIPGISAKAIGIASQKARFESIADALDLRDPVTGKIREFDMNGYDREQMHELAEAYAYLKRETGADDVMELYGFVDSPTILRREPASGYEEFFRDMTARLPLDRYPYYLGTSAHNSQTYLHYSDNRLEMEMNGRTIFSKTFDTATLESAYLESAALPDSMFTFANDSILIIADGWQRTPYGEWTLSFNAWECPVFSSMPLD